MSSKKVKISPAFVQSVSRKPKNSEDPGLYNSKTPVWKFSDLDYDFKWGWDYLGSLVKFEMDNDLEAKLLACGQESVIDSILKMSGKYYTYDKLITHLNRNTKGIATIDILCEVLKKIDRNYVRTRVIDKLSEFENLTWEEIKRQTFGSKGKSKHHVQDIHKLHEDAKNRLVELQKDDSQIFSFRLEGAVRVWGILDRGVFSILWFDPYHEIYELDSKDNNPRFIK